MNRLTDIIDSIDDAFTLVGATEEDIVDAEEFLGLSLAEDYKEYVSKYGILSFEEHEISGLCNHKRLDVRDLTEEERKVNDSISKDLYVIEQLDIDGIVIWQNEIGEIFQTMPGREAYKICDSLAEYLQECI